MNRQKEKQSFLYFWCDGFCRKCRHQENCKVYQEKFDYEIKCIMQGKDPKDWQEIFGEIKKRLENVIKKDETQVNNGYFKIVATKEKAEKIKDIKKDKLFIESHIFANQTNRFLNKIFSVPLSDEKQFSAVILQEDLENLVHYCHLIEIKIYESFWESDNSCLLKNIAIAYFSLVVCQKAIQNFLEGLGEVCSIESLFLLEKIFLLKKEIFERFPLVKEYKEKIIFNTIVE